MNYRKYIVGSVVLLGIIASASSYINASIDCGPQAGRDFQDDFNYMTSTAESCAATRHECDAKLPHWTKPIIVRVYADAVDQEKTSEIEAISRKALREISMVTPVLISNDQTLDPNLLVYVMNEKMAAHLNKPEAKNAGFHGNTMIKRAYKDKSCAVRLFVSPLGGLGVDEYQDISASAVFVHESLEGFDLQSCIYEEMAGAVGLVNDPIGLPSLFSEDGYNWDGEIFSYSPKVLLMFEAIYSIAKGQSDNIEDFCSQRSSRV